MPSERFDNLTYLGQVRRLRGLAKTALSDFGLDGAKLKLLDHKENATFQVDAQEGSRGSGEHGPYFEGRYLLKVHGANYQSAAFITSELEWLRALRRDTDLAVPEPVLTLAGKYITEASNQGMPGPRVCSLLRWMSGRSYRRASPNRLAAIGEVMAQLHNHAEVWLPPSGFTRRRLDWNGLFGDEAGFDVSPQNLWSALPHPYAELFEAVSEKVRLAMRELGDGPEVFGLIHADLHTGNILFSGNETRVIDFDDSGFGYRVYDMAVSLLENGKPKLRDDLLRGYAKHRPVPKDQLEYLDTFISARRLSDAEWVLNKGKHLYSRYDTSQWLESTAQALKLFLGEN